MTQYWFIPSRYKQGSKLALVAFVFAFFVIMLGAYTRLTDAGLSCPDWPHCYGFITAPHTVEQIQDATARYPLMPVEVKKAWTEMTHRYCAGMEGILILALAYILLRTRHIRALQSTVKAGLLIGLLGIQVGLGALTVTQKLTPVIVLSHLLTGISILSTLWWIFLDDTLRRSGDHHASPRHAAKLLPFLWLGFIVVAAQITLGGWVSTHYAGLACVDFPYCNGQILPALQWNQLNSDLITIHMLHRIGAMITAIYVSLLALRLLFNSTFRPVAYLLFVLLGAQLTLGIVNILWLRPVWIAMMHQAVAILLLLTMILGLVKATIDRGRHDNWIS